MIRGGRSAHILGLGASTPIGRTIWASAAAARAGISGFSEHPFLVDRAGQPMRIARASWLAVEMDIAQRCCELLSSAVDEALGAYVASPQAATERVNLALALAADRPGRPPNLREVILTALAERYPSVLSFHSAFECGHAGGCAAFQVAVRSLMEVPSAGPFLVVGVDSYISAETLEWIEENDQLHGAGLLNNAWGFIPGEAASAVLVGTAAFAEHYGRDIHGEVVSVGLGRERHVIRDGTVCLGEGLTHAFRAALAPLESHEAIHNVICDLNGETYRADEYGFTALRLKERFRAAADFVAPADCWGDIGAAGTPLHTALAVIAHRKRYDKGPLSMVWGSSEGGERGAVVIRAAPAGEM